MTRRHREQREAIRARADRALAGLYHNGTVGPWPTPDPLDEDGSSGGWGDSSSGSFAERVFSSWFEDMVSEELDYVSSGGANGFVLPGEAGATGGSGSAPGATGGVTGAARARRRAMPERARCNALDTWGRASGVRFSWSAVGGLERNVPIDGGSKVDGRPLTSAMWECIGAYRDTAWWDANPNRRDRGCVGQYGRGGRTVAPDGLMVRDGSGGERVGRLDEILEARGGLPLVSYDPMAGVDDSTGCEGWARVIDLIRVVEAFNWYVRGWCRGVEAMWAEWTADPESVIALPGGGEAQVLDAFRQMRGKKPVRRTVWV